MTDLTRTPPARAAAMEADRRPPLASRLIRGLIDLARGLGMGLVAGAALTLPGLWG